MLKRECISAATLQSDFGISVGYSVFFERHPPIVILLDPETGNIVNANQAASDFYGIIEPMPRDLWSSTNQGNMVSTHWRADGSIRDVEIFWKTINLDRKHLVSVVIHDVTRRNRLEAISLMRIRLLQLAEELPANKLLQFTLDKMDWLTKSPLGFAFLVEESQISLSGESYSTNTLKALPVFSKKGGSYPLDKKRILADVLRERKAVIYNHSVPLPNDKKRVDGHVEMKRELVVPVIRKSTVVAIFCVGNKPTDYNEEEIEWIMTLANQAWDIIAKKIAEEKQDILAAKLQQASNSISKFIIQGHATMEWTLGVSVPSSLTRLPNGLQEHASCRRQCFQKLSHEVHPTSARLD